MTIDASPPPAASYAAFGLRAEAERIEPGLHLVATPIGNLKDVSFRALSTLAAADVILSLDWVDLGGTLKAAKADAFVISATLDHHIHNGWSMDHQAFAPVDMMISADPDAVAIALSLELGAPAKPISLPDQPQAMAKPSGSEMTVEHLAFAVRKAVSGREISLTHLPLSWNGIWWPFRHPLDYLGSDGGGGIGGGPGISVGAALALKGSGRMPVAICGDGDYLMGVTALWTAAHYRIPLLMVVANNRSFFNDELHQERVARMRNRPVENRWIGQRIADPDIDLAAMARAQGAKGFGPVSSEAELSAALKSAIEAVDGGDVAVVDVRVEPGYAPAMTSALTRKAD